MTIKQNGGVFGRNPTFNDVTIEGQLTFDGDIDINSDLKVNGDLDVVGDITAGNQASLKTVISEYSMEVGGQYGKMVGTKTGSGVGGLEFYSYYGGLYKTADLTSSGHLNLTTGTGTSEILDDYEEGTFTVTTASDATGTLSLESGSYTKIGNIVHIRMAFVVGTGFTSTRVGGLPYTVSPSSISGTSGAGIVAASWIQFYFDDDEQVSFASAPGAGATFRLSFTYQTA